ncbi:MAG: molybdenum transporter, periplasmic molybdate-binding protein [Candidatus Solibacter sp.]|nr:molybdenum transporter, periplasmic molybdate-binding protein [Candidatus Solibacter sp.]
MTVSLKLVAALALTTLACRVSPPAKVTVAAAADLKFAMDELTRAFHKSHPEIDIEVAYGSSGNFFAQIQSGAPFDIFLSADVDYARKLGKPVFTYAVGRLVVWVPASSRLDAAIALRDPALKHLAIANPVHAPYGRAAEAALRNFGVWDSLRPRIVLGENIAQTLQFVQSGVADAGVVALSLALAPSLRGQGRYWEIPLDKYPRMEQGGAILKDTEPARQFRDFLLSAAGRSILKDYGFLE